MTVFLFSWVIQVQAGQTWETIYLVANHCMRSIGTTPSGKILAAIQLPVEILPWFYGQKYEGAKLFYFSTKAPYHWDYSHHYNNNSSVVKNLESCKKLVWANHLSARVERSHAEHCVPVPVLTGVVHSSCQAFAEYLEEKLANGQTSHHPTELVLPTPSHTNLAAAWGPLASCRAPCTKAMLTARAEFCLKHQL